MVQAKNIFQQAWWLFKSPFVYKNPLWYLAARNDEPVLVSFWSGGRLLVRDSGDAIVVNEIFLGGIYDHVLQGCASMIDVGGHIGCASLRAWQLGARQIVTYEPHPANYYVCKKNLVGKAHVIEAAVNAHKGTATLHFGMNSGTHSLHSEGPGVEVWTVTLENPSADVLKIDAEDAEYGILLAANLSRVRRLVVETTDTRVAELLRQRGFATTEHDLLVTAVKT